MPGLPANEVVVEARGREAIRVGGDGRAPRALRDRRRRLGARNACGSTSTAALAAAITRAGGLSFEAVREDLEPALVGFVAACDPRSDRRSRSDHAARVPPLKSGTYAMVGATIVDGTGRPPIADGVVAGPRRPHRRGRPARVGHACRPDVPIGRRRRQDDRPGPVGHAHARRRRSSGRRSIWPPASRPCATWATSSSSSRALRDAIASRRALGPRILAAGLVDGGGPNAFGVVLRGDAGGGEAGRREVPRRRLPADQDLQPGHAADRRGDLRRGAPARHDRHRPRAERHDDRAGRRRPGWITSRTSRIRGEAGSDEVKQTIAFLKRSQDGDRSDAVVERAARPRGSARRSRRFSRASRRFRRRSTACSRTPAPPASTRPTARDAPRARPADRQGAARRRRADRRRHRRRHARAQRAPRDRAVRRGGLDADGGAAGGDDRVRRAR